MKHSLVLGLCLSLVACGLLEAQNRLDPRPLRAGELREGRLKPAGDGWETQTFRIDLPEDVLSLHLEVLSTDLDIDLFLSRESQLEDLYDAEFSADSGAWRESLEVNAFHGDEAFASGTWYVHVAGFTPELRPRRPQGRFSLRSEVTRRGDRLTDLRPGQPARVELRQNLGMTAFFRFRLDEPGPWRLDVLDAQMDLDLYVKRRSPPTSRKDADFRSETLLAREWLSPEGISSAGEYFVALVGQPASEHPETVSLLLSLGRDPPFAAVFPRPLEASRFGTGPAAQALAATVELVNESGSGSGVVVHPRGLILTNAHVVEENAGGVSDLVYVSVIAEPGQPPLEAYRGRVLAQDFDRDLALVLVTGDLWGRPLPGPLDWPALTALRFTLPGYGETLWVSGFPGLGGSGSRVPVNLSRGILSGYEDTWFGTVLKTDASINSGNSGGPVVDEQGRLVGLATAVIGEDEGQVGFVHPVNLIPESWRPWITDPTRAP